MLNQNYLQKD